MNLSFLKRSLTGMLVIIAALAAFSMVACGKQGDAEKAGESVDEAFEDTKDNVGDVFDNDGPAEEAGEKVDDAMDGN